MQLQEAIIHGIEKSENSIGAGTTKILPRTTELPIDDRLLSTADNIAKIYSGSVNGFGIFDPNETRYQFPALLRKYAILGEDFVHFSKEATKLIASEMGNAYFANGGYSLFLRYTNQGQDWLLVVMLKLKSHTGIDEKTLSLLETLSFDIDHLHEAARIDINKWQNGQQPYVSFIKKSKGGEDVTRYFREALGCTEYTDSKRNTTQMKDAVDKFCRAQGWTPEQRNEARRKTYEYCETKNRDSEPVNIVSLSAYIYDQQPNAFLDYIRENSYEIDETFKPHKKTYSMLQRIDVKLGSIKISFDVEDVLQQRIDYDPMNNCLIIGSPSQGLIDRLKEIKSP